MIDYAVIEADLGCILKLPALHSAYFYFKAFWYYEVTGNISTFPFFVTPDIPGLSHEPVLGC